MPPLIELREVSLLLDRRSGSEVRFALDAFELEAGEAVALTGPSGCGKSTLLNLVAGLRRPDAGTVRVGGVDLVSLPPARLDRHRGRLCGMVFQSFHLLAPFSALENVLIGLRFGARPQGGRRERAVAALERVGLAHRMGAKAAELSVGERQRVAIARAIAGEPALLLADEPTGSLDPATAAEVFALLREAGTEGGRSLLMVTHDRDLAAALPRRFDCSELVSHARGGVAGSPGPGPAAGSERPATEGGAGA